MKKFKEITIGDTLYTCSVRGEISKFIILEILNYPDCYYFKMDNDEYYWHVSKVYADETFNNDTATSKDEIKQISIGIIRDTNFRIRDHRRFLRRFNKI